MSIDGLIQSTAITPQEYYSTPGLNHTGMKDLEVSPLRYWYLHVNPERPVIEPTPEMQFGSAVHCAVLEPHKFDERYACELIPPEDCLDTIGDIREWITSKGEKPKGTRKDEVIAQALAIYGESPQILQVLQERHAREHEGKVIFKVEDWLRIAGCAKALRDEPHVNRILDQSQTEVPLFATDPDTGVALKGCLDAASPEVTLDLKTFFQKSGRTIDQSVSAAIWYEKYYRQMYFYWNLRVLSGACATDEAATSCVIAFVESQPPHETRIRVLRGKTGGNPNLYWLRARQEVRSLINTYAECVEQFGMDRPWRYAQEITPLADEELPGVAY